MSYDVYDQHSTMYLNIQSTLHNLLSTIQTWQSKPHLHDQMVSYKSIFFAMTSISACLGSPQDDINKEGQACAAMAAALPQLQTNPGRNHRKSINIISEQYHSSSSSYERIPTFSWTEHNTYLYQLTTPVGRYGRQSLAVGQEEVLYHRGAITMACIVVQIRWIRTSPGSLIYTCPLKDWQEVFRLKLAPSRTWQLFIYLIIEYLVLFHLLLARWHHYRMYI